MFYYLELDNRSPGFDAAFESSAFSNASDSIEAITKHLKLKSVFSLMSTSEYNHLCPEGYEETVVPWFEPQEGIDWLSAIMAHVRAHPQSVGEPEGLVADLLNCRGILEKARAVGAKWHFGMDI